jgi:pimeloyl-ACP methyl ester carboxylesterase
VRIQFLALICGVLFVRDLARAAPQDVTFVTKDSVTIYATFYPCESNEEAPGLVLLHMLKHKRQDWDGFAQEAVKAGFAVLAIDLRGHGQSIHQGQSILDVNEFSNAEFASSVEDVSAAVAFLRKEPGIDGSRISLVGASIGANLALKCAATDPTIRSVVLLSPGLEYRGLTTEDAMVRYGNRPIFLIASRDDDYASDSVVRLASLAKGSVKQQLFENAGHGTFMFQAEPDLGKMMLDWLKSTAQ